MRKSMVVFIALALLVAGGTVWAATTTVAVSAIVTGTCRFNSGGTIAFGTLDPSTALDVNGTVGQPAFWCTKGATYTISDDSGLNEATAGARKMKHATLTDLIPYSMTYTATGTGAGKTSPTSMNIAATVLNADYVNVSAGSYADTITLTIAP
jgi:spore coat protein U-like protein